MSGHAEVAYERGGPGTRRRVSTALLGGLTVGVLCLAAACGGASSTSSAGAGRTAAPAPSATTASAATNPSSTANPSQSPTLPPASLVTAGPASATQIAEFTAAANGQCGFTSSAFKLTGARVTNNGWGSATVTADNPADQGNASVIFRIGSAGWTYVACGSDFTGDSIPQNVLNALFG